MIYRPTPEQIAASHALGEALLRFLLLSQPEPPAWLRSVPEPVGSGQGSAHVASQTDALPATQLLYTTIQAARLLSISDRTLWSLTAPRGRIPAVRIGKTVRYSVEALREWVNQAGK